jgi:uncharacterized protein YqiB (DUF1249 family)
MVSDHLCTVSWRARPRSFVGLMTLYESNFIRLGWLVADLRSLADRAVSRTEHDCPLELTVLARARYTTTVALSYLFVESGRTVRDPGLEVRIYHDARLAEAAAVNIGQAPTALRRVELCLPRSADGRWSGNMLLNKWLEYCAARGHRFLPGQA